ncbi:hypothetical protein [Delftia tsuruhatensis]|uniref:hypothetical protein n=1 Tax=Delftia tsuruhatensis TaxID=180282 RepID=UPI002090EBCD|nr:hypothetical protein [Delftia tsuruhatensis]MCO5337598.1 hypothetical protein [Delftia tsuruhatensis]MCR4545117.1 hypothetical protein [Delftia tsuruhatensis]
MTSKLKDISPKFLKDWLLDSGLESDLDYLSGSSLEATIDASWFRRMKQAPTMLKICIIYSGMHKWVAAEVSERMDLPIEILESDLGILGGLSEGEGELLSVGDTEKILRLCSLIGHVGIIVEESGLCTDFDAASWFSAWLYSPLPAIASDLPARLNGTSEGIDYLRQQVDAMQSAAYL